MAAKKIRRDECVISIDAGTQSIRAATVDMKGDIVDIVRTPIEPYFSERPGWAEQDPDYYWKNLCLTCRRLMRGMSFHRGAVKGITLTTMRSSFINLDRSGKPLRPAMVWLDQRKAEAGPWPHAGMRIALGAVNLLEPVLHAIRESEANWIMQNQPRIWEQTHKFLLLSGYFTYRLTGEFADSTGNTIAYLPFDYRTHQWAKPGDMKWKMFPIDPSKLHSLVKPAGLLGYISVAAARDTGLPAGLPLIAAAADKSCEALGSGCLSPETGCLSYGTTATVETTSSRYVEVVPFFPPYPGAVPGFYNTEVMIYRGYWMVSWFRHEFGFPEERMARKRRVSPESLFDDLVRDIPPGSMGLTLQPFWSPGVKVPGPEAKGAIIGFGDIHTRAHIYRAILEGLAYALKEGAMRTEKKNGVKMEKLRLSGGGSQSRVAMQLTADIFDLPVERPHTFETSTRGAAIDAAVGLGLYPDFESAVRSMTRIRDAFEPVPEHRDIYQELFSRVYMRMYDKLKPLYRSIRDITGYPAKSR